MAAGDIKGGEVVTIQGTLGATTTLGQVVHLEEDDGYWDPVVDGDTGKFGVALKAGAEAAEVPIAIWGRVEVTATAAAIAKGANVIAGSTGMITQAANMTALDAPASYVEATVQTELDKIKDNRLVVGTVMEAFDSSGTGTLFIGLM